MSVVSALISTLNRGPLLTPEATAVKRRRGLPIMGYIGPNGAGKSLLAAQDSIPTLRGVPWSCDNPDHLHTRRGQTHGVRRVLSTMPFVTPSGAPHPLYVPLTDYSQIIFCEHVDLILDEVGGAVASTTGDDIPIGVKASLQELRRREVVCRWTAPSWSRASKVLREVSQGVTLTMGYFPVAHKDGVPFDGPHDIETLSVDSETLVYETCDIEGEHQHDTGRIWGARRLMYARTFDANVFDEWTTAKREKIKPVVRTLFWRPGSAAESVYDTHGYVEKLGQVTDSGRCDHCGGRRTPQKCTCDSPATVRGARRRAADAAAVVDGDTVEIVAGGGHVHA
ncbi:hypothetical protein AB4Z38_25245 [Arthrobacter sp. 2RAF6]|uniref:hypothetical protein n=1 Tax=Arthrobacter sp. 2RAF6 TaxID=3233002 RepID=UPI003F8ECBCB